MGDDEGNRGMFDVASSAYDTFMGRYSRPMAALFTDAVGLAPGDTAIDVGCGPGALTEELVERLGADAVRACDPSPGFVAACADRNPGVDVRQGWADAIPFDTGVADYAMAQLVLHFVDDPDAAAHEMSRVARPGGTVAACVWDFDHGMEMLRAFWDAALSIDPDAPDEARTLRFGRPGEIAGLFESAGLRHIQESTLTVSSTYASFHELWSGFDAGVGPAGSYCRSLPAPERARLRSALDTRLGSPTGSFTLRAVARCASGRVRTR